MFLDDFSIGAVLMEDGRLELDDRRVYRHQLQRMKPGRKTVTVADKAEKRSKTWEQVKWWWCDDGPVKLCAEHCGYTPAQMHYALLGECFGWVEGPHGHPIPAKPSMSEYSVEEMTHIIDWVLTWAPSELGVLVQEPDKNWRQKKRSAA